MRRYPEKPTPPEKIAENFQKEKFSSPEAKEKIEPQIDTLIVFGQGPVKPVLLETELTEEQRKKWEEFKEDPLHKEEPDFRVIEDKAHLKEIEKIQENKELTQEEKEKLIKEIRNKWQHSGRLALNRWGRQNAMAAGLALFSGATKELILSGGKTMPSWAKEKLPEEIIENWPSEAELMKDLIVRRYGKLYQEKYGRPIEEAIKIEDKSTNTLENFAYTINNHPDIFEKSVGFLAADFHLRRVGIIARLFSFKDTPKVEFGAQKLLEKEAQKRKKEKLKKMLDIMRDPLENPEFAEKLKGEERWERGLIDPQYLSYWLGYIGLIEDPKTIQKTLKKLRNPYWVKSARELFEKVGLNFDEISEKDLERLQKEDPEGFAEFVQKLRKIKTPEFRKLPPK